MKYGFFKSALVATLFLQGCGDSKDEVIVSAASRLANNDGPPVIFFDEVMPIYGSVGLFNALKNNQISALYVRPIRLKEKQQPVYRVTYVNDFDACLEFDGDRTFTSRRRGYELSSRFFDKNASVDLYMEVPNSADFVNGECLLAVKANLVETDFIVSLKDHKTFTHQIKPLKSSSMESVELVGFENFKISKILTAIGQPIEEIPKYDAYKSNVGKVSDANLVRALQSDNDTMKHTALYLIHHRLSEYGNEYVRLEPTTSPEVLKVLSEMPYLKSNDERKRVSVLNAIGIVMTSADSDQAKQAVMTALESEYPFTMPQRSRDLAKRLDLEIPAEGQMLPGYMSAYIVLGSAMPLHEMSSKDRDELLSRFPDIMQKLSTGYNENSRDSKMLRKLTGN